MAPPHPTARSEREKKVKSVIAFASTLSSRFEKPHDRNIPSDLQSRIHILPLPASSVLTARRDELEALAVELWNLATRLRRDEDTDKGRNAEDEVRKSRALALLRVFSFLLLDSAGGHAMIGQDRKSCTRLMKVALKAAKCCIENGMVSDATKVLERAAEYQEVLGGDEGDRSYDAEGELAERLRVEYFALRTALAWKSDRMDTAEHMFAKCKGLSRFRTALLTEDIADLLYEMGKDFLGKHNYESAVLWLERAHDVLGEHDREMLSAEAGELRLSIMQSTVQAYMKLNNEEARSKAWHMLRLLKADYADKMSVTLLKVEMLFSEPIVDADQVYLALNRMMRSIVLNDRNFMMIMHNIHKLKDHNNVTACKLIDEVIETRLFREEKEAWIEKAVITRVWISCTTVVGEGTLEQLRELFDLVLRNAKVPFSAPATHATQTLLWKQVEATFSQGQHEDAEAWCGVCLHLLFDKAGEHNKSKIARKMILCALARHDYAAARELFSKMSDLGQGDRVTRYLMYKVALYDNDSELAVQCLDAVCRQSSNDTTLLYACVVEAQQSGNRRQGTAALEKLLEQYNKSAPADVHLPALLRMIVRLLVSELIKDGSVQLDIFEQLCKTFEAASIHAKASRRRPSNPSREQFNADEFQWFSKNTYNLAIRYCAEVPPQNLVRAIKACIEFIDLFRECNQESGINDVQLRLMFCHYLSVCAFVTLARAEDCKPDCIQYYLDASKHGRDFRVLGNQVIQDLSGPSKADMIAKHFQIVKLELEAALKREQWDELDHIFEECWKYGGPDRYDTLADLVLVIFSCMSKDNVDSRYQSNVLATLQKIINASGKSAGSDVVKMSRWIRCLFQLALTFDETISLKCIDHAIRIASSRKGTSVSYNHMPETPPPTSPLKAIINGNTEIADDYAKEPNHYPAVELEWLATTAFNHAIDYYVQENDDMCRRWAEKALNLAEWTENGNGLGSVLMEKYKKLTWDNET